jgi:Helix-turn-helix domain
MTIVDVPRENKGNRAHFQRRREMWTIAILGHPTLSPTAKNVGVAISIHMNGDSWQAWPSHQRLAKMCSISKRTAERSTRELEEAGLLSISRKANCPNRYEMRGGTDRDDDTDCQLTVPDSEVPTAVSLGTDEDDGGYRRGCRPNL